MSEPEVNGAKIGLPARRLAWEVLEAVAAGAYADVALERALRQNPCLQRIAAWLPSLLTDAFAGVNGWMVGSIVSAKFQPINNRPGCVGSCISACTKCCACSESPLLQR